MDKKTFLEMFGIKCKAARKKMGISQELAAEQIKIDYRHYQNIEGGKINIRMDMFIKIINFYDFEFAVLEKA